MTWTKLSDDFGEDCARVQLSDAAFRTHVEGLLWTMRRGTGGQLDRRDIDRLADTDAPMAAVKELLDVGFWQQTEAGFLVVHAMSDQIEPHVIEHRRKLAAERQQRKRLHDAGDHSMCLPKTCKQAPVTRDVTRDKTRDPGLVGSGLDGRTNYSPREGEADGR
jgi:hypothetical protein